MWCCFRSRAWRRGGRRRRRPADDARGGAPKQAGAPFAGRAQDRGSRAGLDSDARDRATPAGVEEERVMRRNLMVPAALLILAVTGCAKQPATMPASATAPSPGATAAGGAGALGRQQFGDSQQATTQGAVTARPVAARTDASGRPSPRDFSVNADVKDIYFDFDKYDIRSVDQKTLDANAAWLKSNARALLLIEGHCDERGTPEYNLALGERRAQAAMSYLVALGIQANRISIVSYGSQQPVCQERSEACWAKNRRAHFLVKSE